MGLQDMGMWPLMFPAKTSELINFPNTCFARGQALFQTTRHVPSPSSFEDRIANKTESQPPKVKAQPTVYSVWGIYGTLEGCNFIFRAQLSKRRVLHPWQNRPGTHVTADLQLYLSFVHYFPKQTELHVRCWAWHVSLTEGSSCQCDNNARFSQALCKPVCTSLTSLLSMPWDISHPVPLVPPWLTPQLQNCRSTASAAISCSGSLLQSEVGSGGTEHWCS